MAEERPTLHIDTDWKKQAQEEKRKLAEEQAKAAAAPPPAAPVATPPMIEPLGAGAPAGAGAAASGGGKAKRGLPTASFSTLVQALLTQALFYLGEITSQGAPPTVNLDMAKHQLDTLSILEEKTANNLDAEERHLLDAALYDVRTRFVSVASQYL